MRSSRFITLHSVCFACLFALWLLGTASHAWGQHAPEVAYYTFDEGSGMTTENRGDPGVGLLQAEFNNAPDWVGNAALGDYAVGLDGNTELFTAIDTAILSSTDWTIEFWLRASAVSGRQAILSDGGDFGIYLFDGTGEIILYDDTTDAIAWSGQSVTTGQWRHVAFSYDDSTETVDAYVDGLLTFEDQPFSHDISSGLFYLFQGGYTLHLQAGSQPIGYFEQQLDDFRIWTQARTDFEVRIFHEQQAPFSAGLHLWRLGEPRMAETLPVNEHKGEILAGSVIAYAVNAQQLDELVVDNAGTAAQGLEVTLWEGPSVHYDPQLASELGRGELDNGQALVEVEPALAVQDREVTYLFLTFSRLPSAVGGETFAPQLAEGSSWSLSDGTGHGINAPFPFEWTTNTLFGPYPGLPAFEDFSQLPTHVQFQTGPGHYPTASGAGEPVDSVHVTAETEARLRFGAPSLQHPVSANSSAALDFPSGLAYGALEFHYDVSAYNLAAVPLWLSFYWNNLSMSPDPGSHVFVSVDGGETWLASLYEFALPQQSTWQHVAVDVAQAITDAGTNAKAVEEVVIRFQGHDVGPFNQRGLLIDNVSLARGSHLRVTRVGHGVVPDSSTDDWGEVAGPGETTAQFALENVGVSTLEVMDLQVHAFSDTGSGQDSVTAELTEPLGLQPGEIHMVPVTLSLAAPGPVSFEVAVTTNDPVLPGGVYLMEILAEGANLAPSIRPASWAREITGNQAAGYAYEVRAERPLVNVTLLVEDPNGDEVEVLRVDGPDVAGVRVPLPPSAPSAGPVELQWTGIAFPAGRYRYTVEASDGALTTTTTLELFFDSPVEDHVESITCGARPRARGAELGTLALGLALLALLAGAGWVRRQRP